MEQRKPYVYIIGILSNRVQRVIATFEPGLLLELGRQNAGQLWSKKGKGVVDLICSGDRSVSTYAQKTTPVQTNGTDISAEASGSIKRYGEAWGSWTCSKVGYPHDAAADGNVRSQ